MTEPVYTFVKGQGWVLEQHDQLTFEIEGVSVTLVARRPEVGEFFWTGPWPITALRDTLCDSHYRNIFRQRAHRTNTPVFKGLDKHVANHYMTVIYND